MLGQTSALAHSARTRVRPKRHRRPCGDGTISTPSDATVPEILEPLHPRTEEIKTRIAYGEIREHLCSGCAGERSGARTRLAPPRDRRRLRDDVHVSVESHRALRVVAGCRR